MNSNSKLNIFSTWKGPTYWYNPNCLWRGWNKYCKIAYCHPSVFLLKQMPVCGGVRKHAQFVFPHIQSNGHLFLKHAFSWDQIFTACSNVCVLVFLNITGNLIIIASAISISEISSGVRMWYVSYSATQRADE